jgi:hypothetical protein
MDKKVKKEWINALRSGKYRQAESQLKIRESGRRCSYCCLGVLCNIVDKSKWDGECWDGADTELPEDLKIKLGISDDQQSTLISMNDGGDDDFNTIADYIEANL